MNINSITFRAWTKDTCLPETTDIKTKKLIEEADMSKNYLCSYKNGILKAARHGKNIFIEEIKPENFSQGIIRMYKELLFDKLIDKISLEG